MSFPCALLRHDEPSITLRRSEMFRNQHRDESSRPDRVQCGNRMY